MVSTYTKRLIIIVAAAVQAAANQAAKHLDPVGGEHTFTVPLSPDGKEPITHYWCSTAAQEEAWRLIQQLELSFPAGSVRTFDGIEPQDVLQWMGLRTLRKEIA